MFFDLIIFLWITLLFFLVVSTTLMTNTVSLIPSKTKPFATIPVFLIIRQPHVKSAVSPMMQQYPSIKAQHTDKLVFYRMGDFTRCFRRCGRSGKTFGYYPDHARTGGWQGSQNGRRAVSRRRTISGAPGQVGQSVAICEQVGEVSAGKEKSSAKSCAS